MHEGGQGEAQTFPDQNLHYHLSWHRPGLSVWCVWKLRERVSERERERVGEREREYGVREKCTNYKKLRILLKLTCPSHWIIQKLKQKKNAMKNTLSTTKNPC